MLPEKLVKLTIVSREAGEKLLPKIPKIFQAMYNPTEFDKNLTVDYKCKDTPGSNTKELSFYKTNTGDVSFELLFDATGASVNSIQGRAAHLLQGVDAQIELFHALTVEREPESHEPRVLTLVWGTFIFHCRLKSSSVKYTLFSPSGRPLRATLSVKFKGHEKRIYNEAISKLFSPDLTKIHLVKAGETLPIIAARTYEDDSLYLEIARINKLKNFRALRPGMELILPPINKIESRA